MMMKKTSDVALKRAEGSGRALWAVLWAIVNDMERRDRRQAAKVAEIVLDEVRGWTTEDPPEIDPVMLQASVEQLEVVLKRFQELNASDPPLWESLFWLRRMREDAKRTAGSGS